MKESDWIELYKHGQIATWYLRDSQLGFYQMIREQKRVVAKCHRRWGKTTTFMAYVCERAATEKIIVRYGGPTQKQAYEILDIVIEHIYCHCPNMRPRNTGGNYGWPSGSVMYVFGMKDAGEADKARGTEADIIIADEFAFWRHNPLYTLKSVLSPQLDTTDGQLIITSTPPQDLTHPYIDEVAKAETDGYLFEWTINQSLHSGEVSLEQHERIIERCGGVDTDTYKREYGTDLIPNRAVLVIPEGQETDLWQGTQERPDYFDYYCCFDLGFVDYFAGIYGYLDFLKNRLVIEREVWQHYKSTGENVDTCLQLESEIDLQKGQITRWGDCADRQQLYDMERDHDFQISPISKRSKMSGKPFRDSCLNSLRLGISQGKILVDEETCPNLSTQIKFGFWNEKRTDFERTESMGHLDALMALAYLYDNLDWTKNPFGIGKLASKQITDETHFVPQKKTAHGKLRLVKMVKPSLP